MCTASLLAPIRKRPPYKIDDVHTLVATIIHEYLPLGIHCAETWVAEITLANCEYGDWGVALTLCKRTPDSRHAALVVDIKRRLASYDAAVCRSRDGMQADIRIYGLWSWATVYGENNA